MGRNHIHFAAGEPGENGVISGKFVLHVFSSNITGPGWLNELDRWIT